MLGKYTLLEILGEGPLGPVYRAFDRDLERPVAVRFLDDGIRWDTDVLARFLRDCQAAAELKHPCLAAIYEIGQEGQSLYIAAELLGGSSLKTCIEQKSALSVEKKLSVMIQVAEGLSHAHANSVLHLDLKPGRIHVTEEGGAKIRDFVIAHVLMRHLTRPVVRWGSPIYLSPEQIQRQDPDERSDVFSAGVVFYELLTYIHPFRHQNSNKAVDKILYERHIPGIDQFPEAPPGIWSILKKCLAKNPGDRYQSMAEVVSAFRELLKDLAEESQLMRVELQASVPRLRKVAEQPGAPEGAVRLLQDIQRLLHNGEDCDYASLDRLMEALAEQYSAIQAAVSLPPAPEGLSPSCMPGQPASALPTPPDTPPPASAREGEQGDLELSDQTSIPTLVSGDSALALPDLDQGPIAQQMLLAGEAEPDRGTEGFDPGSDEESVTETEPAFSSDISPETQPAQPATFAELRAAVVSFASSGGQSPIVRRRFSDLDGAIAEYRHRIPGVAFRMAAVLLFILLIAVAVYIVQSPSSPLFLRTVWSTYAPGFSSTPGFSANHNLLLRTRGSVTGKGLEGSQNNDQASTIRILLAEAQALASQHRLQESRVLVRRILELDPAFEPAVSMLKQIDLQPPDWEAERRVEVALRKGIARVSALIDSGNLLAAITELETLQQIYPRAPELAALRRRWEARNAGIARALTRREEERKDAARLQMEQDRTRRVAELFALGKYSEAKRTLDVWITEGPASSRAREFRGQIEEAQRGLAAYESAMAEKRYHDALSALGMVEKVNPADPNLTEMRRRVEIGRAAARASLTVRRLGDKGTLLLDGKPIGTNGEIENESIPVGSHTLAIEYQRAVQVSRTRQFLDGQRVVYVYDPARRLLRPMAEGDEELVAERKAIEQVHRFEVEHSHGLLRGSCKGILLVSRFDVEYRPYAGSHGFKMPFRRLNLMVDGRSVDLSYASDGKDLQSFKAEDAQSADRLKQVWDRLRVVGR